MDRLASMETFVRVVETGSFSGAARQLRVGQPAVSKSIAQLEQYLGVKLLTRSTRGLTPTEAGLGYLERARRALEEAAEAELAARGAGAGLKGRLRISAAVTFARIHLIPLLPKFLAQNPELDLEIVLDDRQIDLVQEGIDVALRMGKLMDSALTARRISRCKHLVVGTPAYFDRAGTPATPSELSKHQAIVYLQEGRVWSFRRNSSEAAVTVQSRLRVTAAEGVRAAVLADVGLTIASEWMFSPELRSGIVRAVLSEWSLPALDLWAVLPSGRAATAKARAFVDYFERTFST
ncbi:LysR family transcriptional regulator [Bradyrhizobium japonicum]|uniref:LysR family transcriptional regulator n=1 Tax=Bradyrhizobium japonicum TaxID=375 RepID=UPI00057E2C1A|nr:LysR family transcriptional regulator [Bradyrhizobium japonicum]MBR0908298.1 LysR family transcriptional regulator [Bradyrhizobium japonicum]MCD9111668.1 LysR family transcriptional regulator [Bradyrhizobium japonicum]MCD9255722.1 LysR family transcriptional regulator [Bradyrhizobium japonicum SEMIA 5079]MCD9822770.1 LysR family transcriptional regulator [Bradyrhizobium japonicum]MCD9893547.1 LysR family transcriptional regulator [Bradyrhizobium japonicum]